MSPPWAETGMACIRSMARVIAPCLFITARPTFMTPVEAAYAELSGTAVPVGGGGRCDPACPVVAKHHG